MLGLLECHLVRQAFFAQLRRRSHPRRKFAVGARLRISRNILRSELDPRPRFSAKSHHLPSLLVQFCVLVKSPVLYNTAKGILKQDQWSALSRWHSSPLVNERRQLLSSPNDRVVGMPARLYRSKRMSKS